MKKEEKQKKINEIKSFIEKQKVLERDFSILKYLCSVRTTNVIQNVLCLNIKQIEDLELQVAGELSKLKIEKQKIITELTSSWLEDRRRKGRFLSDPKKVWQNVTDKSFR